jgi:hypothetical protein
MSVADRGDLAGMRPGRTRELVLWHLCHHRDDPQVEGILLGICVHGQDLIELVDRAGVSTGVGGAFVSRTWKDAEGGIGRPSALWQTSAGLEPATSRLAGGRSIH